MGPEERITPFDAFRAITAWDLSGKTLYFHTQHNRRVRTVDVNRIDFSGKKIHHIQLDESKEQDIKDLTP